MEFHRSVQHALHTFVWAKSCDDTVWCKVHHVCMLCTIYDWKINNTIFTDYNKDNKNKVQWWNQHDTTDKSAQGVEKTDVMKHISYWSRVTGGWVLEINWSLMQQNANILLNDYYSFNYGTLWMVNTMVIKNQNWQMRRDVPIMMCIGQDCFSADWTVTLNVIINYCI